MFITQHYSRHFSIIYIYIHKQVSILVYSFVIYINEIRRCLALCGLLFYFKIFLNQPTQIKVAILTFEETEAH